MRVSAGWLPWLAWALCSVALCCDAVCCVVLCCVVGWLTWHAHLVKDVSHEVSFGVVGLLQLLCALGELMKHGVEGELHVLNLAHQADGTAIDQPRPPTRSTDSRL